MTGLVILVSTAFVGWFAKATIDAMRMLSPMIKEEGADKWDIF